MPHFSRRRWIQTAGIGVFGASTSGWFPAFADQVSQRSARTRHCILLWMPGAPSQTDTFDMKPSHENGGEFKEIATTVPGMRISEHLPKLAKQAEQLAIVRSLSTKEGDHGRGTYVMRTGHAPQGPVAYPAIGASLGKQLASRPPTNQAPVEIAAELPNYVSIGPFRAFNRDAFGAGFLGPKYAPLVVAAADSGIDLANNVDADGFAKLQVESLHPPRGVDAARMASRWEMWRELQDGFLRTHPGSESAHAHDMIYQRTSRMMSPEAGRAFDLSSEDPVLREAYGQGVFGQGCLLARRLIERGVSFVEVALGATSGGVGWDTHADNFTAVKSLSAELDAGWATLLEDLQQRGLLQDTTILWMGEFGRTPRINEQAGRDHFPQAWSCVFAGGGIAGGQAYGKTSPDGTTVEENKVGVEDVLATLCSAVGVSPAAENYTNAGRPIPLVENGKPIQEILS